MKTARRHGPCLPLLLWVATTVPATAFAALGGTVDTVEADRVSMKAQLRNIPLLQYDVHELTLDSGTVVREYVARGGAVFAVSWQGALRPDLRQLLGGYFGSYRSALQAQGPRAGGHRQLSIQRSDLVVHSFGHLRAFHGFAYAPDLVPAGVALSDLQ